ncbi:MAG TPA: phage holin family protein [Acidimicrobiales bacterium]
MKKSTWRKFMRGNSVQRDLDEIKDLALKYIKEETIQPIKQMGRFVAWGAAGSLLVGFGFFFLLFGALRFLQEQFKVLDGTLSWIPYLIVVVLAAIIIALTLWRIVSGTAKRRLRDSK